MANAAAVTTGPGLLYVAPLGTAEPTSASATRDAAFRAVGYTEEGSQFSYEFANEGVFVAEEYDPIRYDVTSRSGTLSFAMAEATRQNLLLALNQGANATNDQSYLEPPDPGSELRVKILLETYQGARWIFRKCLQTGTMDIPFKKAPDKKLIAVEFKLEVPDNGDAPFRVYPGPGGVI